MKQKIYNYFFIALSGAIYILPKIVLAQPTTPINQIKNCTTFQSEFNGAFAWVPNSFCTANGIALVIIKDILNFSGVIAIIFIMLGGFWYLISAGNEETAEKGKKTLINAVLGLVVVILASVIVRVIANTLSLGT